MPFGEYTPPGLGWLASRLAIPLSDLEPGSDDQAPFVIAGVRVGALICREDLVAEEARKWALRTNLLINPANLGWFGDGGVVSRNLQIVRMRALEIGRPILRVANTGVTASIDMSGRVVARIPANQAGVLEGEIQPAEGLTPYAKWGDLFVLSLCVLFLLIARWKSCPQVVPVG